MGSKFFSGAIYLALQKNVKRHIFKGGVRYFTSNILSNFESNEIVDLIGIQKKQLDKSSFNIFFRLCLP